MKLFFFKRALQDILNNRFLNTVTVVTIALSVLIVSSFALFFNNANELLDTWKKGIRALVYLAPDTTDANRLDLKFNIQKLAGVSEARFISRKEALAQMKVQMGRQSSLLEGLEPNPLPDAFEVRLKPESQTMAEIEKLSKAIDALPHVDKVEYGQQWIRKFTNIINVFKFVGYAMGSLFLAATLLIVANTVRLVLYSRQEEIAIMRLVGATDRFIKTPFYLQGIALGALGGIIGMSGLYLAFQFISEKFHKSLSTELLDIHFLSLEITIGIIAGSMLVGWIGCYVSLKQFLKA
jgi:cell division transport system permease protein